MKISPTTITIALAGGAVDADSRYRTLTIRWTPTLTTRRREIVQGDGEANQSIRPMRTKARLGAVAALRDAHCWLDELLSDPCQTVESIAARESASPNARSG